MSERETERMDRRGGGATVSSSRRHHPPLHRSICKPPISSSGNGNGNATLMERLLQRNGEQAQCSSLPPYVQDPMIKQQKKNKNPKKREGSFCEDDSNSNSNSNSNSHSNSNGLAEAPVELRVLNWGHLKRPRCSRPATDHYPRLPLPPQNHLGSTSPASTTLKTEKGNPPPTEKVSHTVEAGRAFQPRTPSPEDSTSRLLTRNGQELSTVLHNRQPPSRQSGRTTVGRVAIADQHTSSSPSKRHLNNASSVTNGALIMASESASQEAVLLLEEGPAPSRPTAERVGLNSFEWPRIALSLSRKEKEEDFMIMKGSKLPQRPKRRPKAVEKTLRYCIPGTWLSDITRSRYEVREKKSIRKKPTGLKAMESFESDSDS